MDGTNKYKLNPFFKINLSSNELESVEDVIIELLLENKRYNVPRNFLFNLISYVDKLTKSKKEILDFIQSELDLESGDSETVYNNLIDKFIIVPESYRAEDLAAVEHWIERGWLDALILHLTSKDISFSDDNQENSQHDLNEKAKEKIRREGLPETYKKVEGLLSIKLEENLPLPKDRSFEDILVARRTHRPWSKDEFLLNEISSILYYGSIETKRLREQTKASFEINPRIIYNSSFSALEIYLFVHDVQGLEPGLYFYDVEEHSLILLKTGVFREEVSKMCIGQERAGSGRVTFVISANWQKYMFRYRHPRAYRNLMINTSELAQKLLVLSTAYKKTTFVTPAFNDELADNLLNLNGYQEAPLYAVTVG
ncbi:SagB/ThcOx family dehydrogenase [Priestia flexa]|uniref:SagB/ThcOx family dehydrogenase n=1 Tax=Priestia flexa TaxID=86664 RepID=UPI000C240DA5|nr:SagB/ThcOx family dehydrogenase [Priestia flexa]MEC0665829.1 SagB/ThcOx family dehydrogenase [Priestia flexa]